jgi:hypothetical protein
MIKEEIDKIVKDQINKGLIHQNDGAKKEGFEMGLLYALNQGQILHIDSVIKRYSDCCNALIDTDEQSDEICTNCEDRI